MKIYTKTGDTGETGLFGGPRVSKDAPRIEAYGTLDELNAALGVVRATGLPDAFSSAVARVQHQLFDLGAELASPDPEKLRVSAICEPEIASLEQDIDAWEATLPPLRQFILPGGSLAGAHAHVARTVCRRAERRVVKLAAEEGEQIDPLAVKYMNRLSDWLFVLARVVNQVTGNGDTPWQPRSK